MSRLPDYELLSAYLDGELTAAEQADAERLLAADPAARQLLDELRAVGQALQSLPAEKLGEDLREQVLQVAAQRKSAEAATPVEASTAAPRRFGERWKNRRLWLWPSVAVAVALLLMVFSPQQQEPQAPPTRVAARAEKKSEARWRESAAEREKADEALVLDREGKAESAFSASEPAPSVAAPMTPAPDVAKAAPYVLKGVEKQAVPSSSAVVPPSVVPAPSPPAESAPLHGESSAKRAAAPSHGKDNSVSGAMKFKGESKAGELAAGRFLGKRAAGYSAGQGVVGGNAAQLAEGRVADDGLLFVYCDVHPTAQAGKPFDKLLTANGIQFVDAARPDSKAAESKTAELADRMEMKKPSVPQPASKAGAEAFQPEKFPAAPPLDLVYVVAPPAQVELVLAAIKADEKTFSAVQVAPTPDVVDQRRFVQFNRASQVQRPAGPADKSRTELGVAGSSEQSQRAFGGLKTAPQPSENYFSDLPSNAPQPTNKNLQQQSPRLYSNFAQRIDPQQQFGYLEEVDAERTQSKGGTGMGGMGGGRARGTTVQQVPGLTPPISQQTVAEFQRIPQIESLTKERIGPENQRVLFVIRNINAPPEAAVKMDEVQSKPKEDRPVPAKKP